MVMIAAKQKVTLEEYLEREARSEEKHEFINGKIVEMPGATSDHNIIASNILFNIRLALRSKKSQHIVLGSDMKIYIEPLDQVRYPDALVICDEIIHYGDSKVMITNPLLIIEVLSPSTEAFDRTYKFEEYKYLSSFKEYLLVHQDRPLVTTYFKEEEELWRIRSMNGLDQKASLKSIDIELGLSDIYEHITFEENKQTNS